MAVDLETRSLALPDQERATVLAGYAALFGREAVIAGAFRERITRGAFTKSLATEDVVALLDHDSGRVIGRKSAGTLRIMEDARGLAVEIDPPDAPDGETATELVRRGDLLGMSFGFRVISESWEDLDGNLPLRILEEIEIFEVSIVAFPAYQETTIGLRSLEKHRGRVNFQNAARRRAETAMKLRGISLA